MGLRLKRLSTPNNSNGLGTHRFAGTIFGAATLATLTIGFQDIRLEYAYEAPIFVMAAIFCLTARIKPINRTLTVLLALLSSWGFVQLAVNATVYRYVTLQSSLRFAALATTAWLGFQVFEIYLLRAFVWMGTALALISVLAYFTSPSRLLWIFPAAYPDVWGPFLSRNNFAQFLELAMPVALWFALRGSRLYLGFAAIMLASGFASASRAGAGILVFEALILLWIFRKSTCIRRQTLGLLLATIVFAAIPGVGQLAERLNSRDEIRREINEASFAMISAKPWTGFGLGTYATVYPAYAIFDSGKTVDHAHNDWLEWTTEGGVGFTFVWLGLALLAAGPALRSGWGIGVLGCFLHALVDYPFARFGIAAWAFLLIGMLAASDLRRVAPNTH